MRDMVANLDCPQLEEAHPGLFLCMQKVVSKTRQYGANHGAMLLLGLNRNFLKRKINRTMR
jgi:hypothetical protein